MKFLFLFFQNGLNALLLASKEGHLKIVEELLSRGANIEAATKVRTMIRFYLQQKHEYNAIIGQLDETGLQ